MRKRALTKEKIKRKKKINSMRQKCDKNRKFATKKKRRSRSNNRNIIITSEGRGQGREKISNDDNNICNNTNNLATGSAPVPSPGKQRGMVAGRASGH